MTGEAKNRPQERKKEKQKKKVRKDKWGQALPGVAGDQPQSPLIYNSNFAAAEAEVVLEEEKECEYERKKIVVSGMPYSATEDEIRGVFKDVGLVSHLHLSRFPDSNNFSGLAFVTFQTEEIAKNALKLDGTKMRNRLIKVEQCRLDPKRKRKAEFLSEPKKADGCLSVYIGNLSWDVTEHDIRNCLNSCNITSIRFAVDKRTGMFRGYGHIDFADDNSLEEAMKKNQVELHGRPMKIAYAVNK